MKILYINTLYSPYIGGGAEITLQTLVEGIQSLGHEVVVITTGDTPGIVEDNINGVRVLRVNIANVYWQYNNKKPPVWKRGLWHLLDSYNLRMGRVLKEVISLEQPDVINCHNLAGFSASAWAAIEQSGVPLIQVLHDSYNLCPKSTMFRNGHSCLTQCLGCKTARMFTPLISNKVNAVVGVSQFILDKHLSYGLFKKAKIKRAIHNARAISQAVMPYKNKELNKIKFGFIGTLTPAKGIELLLDVYTDLALPNTELWIAGKGYNEYEQQLMQSASPNVHFMGYVKSEEFYPKIDVLIVPSIWQEPLGMIIPEAFAYGIPVIASNRGGIPEMIQEGLNGFLFEPDHQQELAEKIKYFVERPDEIGRMGSFASESARPFLDVNGWIEKYETLYKEIIKS
jgi:glycosyltransferase involved in cell wall biosynthesis